MISGWVYGRIRPQKILGSGDADAPGNMQRQPRANAKAEGKGSEDVWRVIIGVMLLWLNHRCVCNCAPIGQNFAAIGMGAKL